MAIKQLTVFVENKHGTLVTVTDILSKHNINLRALSIAETQDFG
ncbi:MAG: ACT domain-containing protein, partial [Oscillospiraceae bacterium]|nr:ACT domain-containing protein [Oscillospiraceae bacterium]